MKTFARYRPDLLRATVLVTCALVVGQPEWARAQRPIEVRHDATPTDSHMVSPILIQRTPSRSPSLVLDGTGQPPPPEGFCCSEPKFAMAISELIALQVIPNYFNRDINDDSTAVLSPDSWLKNMQQGFEWDNNTFSMNMFGHPFHGNVFFNAGRSNGYNFWASSLFAAGGSFVWEMYGENNPGAINDWIATSMGGIMIGETLHRTAKLIRDNRQTGAVRSLREFGAFFIDPVGSLNRLLRGEASKVGENPIDRRPPSSMVRVATGIRRVGGWSRRPPPGAKPEADVNEAGPYLRITVQYGDWFDNYDQPYSSFQLAAQINLAERMPIGELSIDGTLWGAKLKTDGWSRHTVSANQRFTYIENAAVEFGGPFLGGTLNSTFRISKSYRLDLRIQPMFALMTAFRAQYEDPLRRDYDFGSGVSCVAYSTLFIDDYPALRLGYLGVYQETIDGAPGHHVIHSPSASVRVRVWRDLGVGFDYTLWVSNNSYDDYPDVHIRFPTVMLNLNISALDNLAW